MKLDEGACIYGAGVLLKHCASLANQLDGVIAGSKDIEYIHDARVASRRLRATIPLFQDCLPAKKSKKWLKHTRDATRALGEARDTDVQLELLKKFLKTLPETEEKPGIGRLILRLYQKRQKLQAAVIDAMNELVESQTLEQLRAQLQPLDDRSGQVYLYTPSLYQHSFQSILSRLEDFLSYDEIVPQPDKVTELHQMRIAAKRLRYTMETFAPLYASQLKTYVQAIRKSQDLLGEIHDCDVWGQFLPEFLEEERQRTLDYFGTERPLKRLVPGITYFQQERSQTRAKLYQEFVEQWQQWQLEALWKNLLRAIQIPFPHPDSVYPPLSPIPDTAAQPKE